MLPSRVNLSDKQELHNEAAGFEIDSFMDPLSIEYNNTIKFLQEEIQKHKDEQQNLKFQFMRLIEENKRMYEKLKETLEQRIYESPVEQGTVENLEHQLQTVTEAKNSVLEMWQIALQEIEHLEKLLEEKRNGSELQAVEERIAQVKAEYAEAINVLSEELSTTKIELRNVKNKLQNKTDQLNECKRTVENFSEQLKSKEKHVDDTSLQKKEMATKTIRLESSLAETQKNLSKSNEEISALRRNIQELLSLNADIKKQNAELKLRESASLKEAREGLLTAEKAVLQKEEAVYKEQQALKEIQQLKASVNQVIEQAKERNRSEVKLFKKQYDEKIQQLMEEMQGLELGISEKQNALERALREKRAAESELESLYKENYDGIPNSNPIFEDMSRRLTQAERLRDESQLHAQTLENEIKDLKLSKEHEIHYLKTECKTLKQRLQTFQADFIETSSDRVQLTNQVEQLKKRCNFTEKALAAAENKHKTEFNLLEQKLQHTQASHQQQLQATEEQHKKAISELRYLLDAQHKISNRWREEVNEITLKFETKMKELYDDMLKLQQQNEELSQALQLNQINIISGLEAS